MANQWQGDCAGGSRGKLTNSSRSRADDGDEIGFAQPPLRGAQFAGLVVLELVDLLCMPGSQLPMPNEEELLSIRGDHGPPRQASLPGLAKCLRQGETTFFGNLGGRIVAGDDFKMDGLDARCHAAGRG